MLEISAKVYDNGGVGDGNLTETVDFPLGSGSATNTLRVAQDCYDWRDRLVGTKSGAAVQLVALGTAGGFSVDGLSSLLALNPSAESSGTPTSRPITYDVLDNLGEVTTQQVFAANGVSITSGGTPSRPAAGLLRSETTTQYNADGLEYARQAHSVNQTSGAVDGVPSRNTKVFYDNDGNQTAAIDPLGNVTATKYDDLGDDLADYQGQVLGGTSWAFTNLALSNVAAASASAFDVYVQSGTGVNTTSTDYTVKEGTASLGFATTVDPTHPTLDGWFFLGTVVADSSFSSSLTLSDAADPAATQVCLLQQTSATAYDGDGNVTAKTDAMGRVTASNYDDLGQDVADYRGQVVNSVTDAPGYTTPGGTPTWSFTNITPNYTSTYDVYVQNGDTTADNYTVKQGDGTQLHPVADPTAPSLGNGWVDLGTVTVSRTTSSLTVSHGVGNSPKAVSLLEQTATTAYDADGNATSEIDALGNLTASRYNKLGEDIADYQGQVQTGASGTEGYNPTLNSPTFTWTFQNVPSDFLGPDDVYVCCGTAPASGNFLVDGAAPGAVDPTAPLLGEGWYNLGTVTGSQTITLTETLLTPTGTLLQVPTAVCILQQTSALIHDGDGNVTATIDGMDDVTASYYNDLGQDVADYQGQINTVSSVAGYVFSYLAPSNPSQYDIYTASTFGAPVSVQAPYGHVLSSVTPADNTAPSLGSGWSFVDTYDDDETDPSLSLNDKRICRLSRVSSATNDDHDLRQPRQCPEDNGRSWEYDDEYLQQPRPAGEHGRPHQHG